MPRILKITLSYVLWLIFAASTVNAAVIATVKYKNKNYHVDVVNKSTTREAAAEIWFRVAASGSSSQDILVARLSGTAKKLKEYADLACRQKAIYDGGKVVVGCTSVIGSSFCAVGTVATEGAMAFVCAATWKYAGEKGAADCVEGIADAIAAYLKREAEWKVIATGANLQELKVGEAVSKAIDHMCEDLKKN